MQVDGCAVKQAKRGILTWEEKRETEEERAGWGTEKIDEGRKRRGRN